MNLGQKILLYAGVPCSLLVIAGMTGKNLVVQKAQSQMLLQTTPLSAAVAPVKTPKPAVREEQPTPEIVFQPPSSMLTPRIAATYASPVVAKSKPKPDKTETIKTTDKPVVKAEPSAQIILPAEEIQPHISRDLAEIQECHPAGKIMPNTLYEYKVSRGDFDSMPEMVRKLLEPYNAAPALKDQLDPRYPKQVIGILDYGNDIGILMNSRAVTAYLKILPKLNEAPGVDEEAKATIRSICNAFTASPEKYAFAMVIQPPGKPALNTKQTTPMKPVTPPPEPPGH